MKTLKLTIAPRGLAILNALAGRLTLSAVLAGTATISLGQTAPPAPATPAPAAIATGVVPAPAPAVVVPTVRVWVEPTFEVRESRIWVPPVTALQPGPAVFVPAVWNTVVNQVLIPAV